MKPGLLILDVAHGIDVPGKRSPDGSFEEWNWSRDMVRSILEYLSEVILPIQVSSPFLSFDVEPGLRERVDYYNMMAAEHDDTIMLSLHVDAFKNPPTWWNGTGFSFFTNREHNKSDELANKMVKAWDRYLPEEKIRFNGPGDVSKDKNFTVLYGYDKPKKVRANYHGILIENGFMDGRVDIRKLKDPEWCERLKQAYISSIFEMFSHLGYPIIPELIKTKDYE